MCIVCVRDIAPIKQTVAGASDGQHRHGTLLLASPGVKTWSHGVGWSGVSSFHTHDSKTDTQI